MPTTEQEMQAAVHQHDMRYAWEREDRLFVHISNCHEEANDCATCLHAIQGDSHITPY